MDKYQALDSFKCELMDMFISLCRGNDYNKLTLLTIGETVDRIYNKCLSDMQKEDWR